MFISIGGRKAMIETGIGLKKMVIVYPKTQARPSLEYDATSVFIR